MQSSTGRWVSGDDFFDRDGELRVLESRVRDGNHLMMTGQRRMGKTSVLREMGRRLERDGWIFLFADVEGAASEEDVVTNLAEAVHRVRPMASRAWRTMGRGLAKLAKQVEQLSAHEFAIKFRSELTSGNWRRHGEHLIAHCASFGKPVLMAVDEVPIFLARLLK
jgi:AAA+ ATPase superfamily predicted ATPase